MSETTRLLPSCHYTSVVEHECCDEVADLRATIETQRRLLEVAQDLRDENARLRAFLEGWMPVEAGHGDTFGGEDGERWIQCSEHEAGHAVGDCPQDLDDDDEIHVTIIFGELCAALGGQQP